MNNFNSYPYNNDGFNRPMFSPQNMGRPVSNIILVTSLEEALYRTNERGSDMMYVHQTQPVFYRVKVNADGQKTWAEYPYIVPTSENNNPVTRADLQALEAKIEELRIKLSPEVNHEQSNG